MDDWRISALVAEQKKYFDDVDHCKQFPNGACDGILDTNKRMFVHVDLNLI